MATLLSGSEVKIKKIDNGYVVSWIEHYDAPGYMRAYSHEWRTHINREYHAKDKDEVIKYLSSFL